MSEKHKSVCKALNYFQHFLVFVSDVSHSVSTSAFASLVCNSLGITSSEIGIKIFATTKWIKMYESIIKKIKSMITQSFYQKLN